MPDSASYFIAATNDNEYYHSRFEFWDNVYGYKMETMKEMYYNETCHDYIEKENIISDKCKFHTVDILSVQKEDLNFIVPYNLKFKQSANFNSFTIWIETSFSHLHLPLKINYGPYNERSSYYPLIFYLKREVHVKNNSKLNGSIAIQKLEKGGKHLVLGKVSFNIPSVLSTFQFFKIDF